MKELKLELNVENLTTRRLFLEVCRFWMEYVELSCWSGNGATWPLVMTVMLLLGEALWDDDEEEDIVDEGLPNLRKPVDEEEVVDGCGDTVDGEEGLIAVTVVPPIWPLPPSSNWVTGDEVLTDTRVPTGPPKEEAGTRLVRGFLGLV